MQLFIYLFILHLKKHSRIAIIVEWPGLLATRVSYSPHRPFPAGSLPVVDHAVG